MIKKIAIAFLLLAAACRPQPTEAPLTPRAVTSAPTERAPVSVAFQRADIPTPLPEDIINAADAEHRLLANIYARVAPSVVNVEIVADIPDHPVIETTTSGGSGFVYDLNGHIVTNAHVVEGARQIFVTFSSGYITEARLVGMDLFSDVAVIKVEVSAEYLHPVIFGDSESLRVGDRAIAIGNPFGLATSMTVGIVSGLGRQLPSAELMSNDITPGFQNPAIIQVDTDINPGNSGGPLLNLRGEVIGVNSQIISQTRSNSGIGFAVPSNLVKRVANELVTSGRVNYSYLGISSNSEGGITLRMIEALGIPNNMRGVVVETVTEGGPAAQAGLRSASNPRSVRGQRVNTSVDIITAIDDQPVHDMSALVSYLASNTRPGQTVNLTVWRGGQTINIPVVLGARP